jgi:non-heme chloroperoxidase
MRAGFNDELRKIDLSTLVIHGDDDQIVSIDASARLTAQIVDRPELNVHPGASHGLFATHTGRFTGDLLDFVKS